MDTPNPIHSSPDSIAIIGGGNIGGAIARGLSGPGGMAREHITVTRRHRDALQPFSDEGFVVSDDNVEAVRARDIVILAVAPGHLRGVLSEIAGSLEHDRHILVSVVSGVSIAEIGAHVGEDIPVVRAMPNTAVAIGESMTCLAALEGARASLERIRRLFNSVGLTMVIDEEQMTPATALGACGVAFFLRAIRSASQGGIEVGFHADEAIRIAAQTAKGAASLVLAAGAHPEREIDHVTTPQGCTISGLNEMEHRGFSSAMIKGIVTSAEKAARLYEG